jgi:hypothetical protein
MGSEIRPRMFMFKANIGYMEKVMFFLSSKRGCHMKDQ